MQKNVDHNQFVHFFRCLMLNIEFEEEIEQHFHFSSFNRTVVAYLILYGNIDE